MLNKKKILILGSNEHFSLEKMYYRSFLSLNHYVKLFHINQMHKNLIDRFFWKYFKILFYKKFRKRILDYIKKKNNFDLIIIFKGVYLDPITILSLKKMCTKAKFINIYTDDPFDISPIKDISSTNVLKSIKLYDYFFIWSQEIRKKLKKKLKLKNIYLLPFGYDQFIHKPKKTVHIFSYDISFVGTADNERVSILSKLKDFKIIIAGWGWDEANISGKNIKVISAVDSYKMSKIYQKSKISLNIPRRQNYDSHNMKTFEITSMNGLMLTLKSKDQSKYFPENKACMIYRNSDDLRKKIIKILSNYNEYLKIRRVGLKMSKKHSYVNRAKYLLKLIYN